MDRFRPPTTDNLNTGQREFLATFRRKKHVFAKAALEFGRVR